MRKKTLLFCICAAIGLGLFLTGCKKQTDTEVGTELSAAVDTHASADVLQFTQPEENALCAVFSTDKGEFAALLFPDLAPQAVENFVTLSREGAFNTLTFHRVIENFIIQSGDTDGEGGKSIWRNTFPAESSDLLHHYTGALCMAGGEENGSQFYVVATKQNSVSQLLCDQMTQLGWSENVISAYKKVGGAPYLDNSYTVFGQVFWGMDTVYAVENTASKSEDTPEVPAVLNNVSIITFGQWQQQYPDAKPNFFAGS